MNKIKLVPALVFCCLTMLATSSMANGRCCTGDGDGRSRGRDRGHDGNFMDSHATGNMDLYSNNERNENGDDFGGGSMEQERENEGN